MIVRWQIVRCPQGFPSYAGYSKKGPSREILGAPTVHARSVGFSCNFSSIVPYLSLEALFMATRGANEFWYKDLVTKDESVIFTMRLTTSLPLFISLAVANAIALDSRATGGFIQNPSGSSSFTMYSGCNAPGEEFVQVITSTISHNSVKPVERLQVALQLQ